MWSEHLRGRRPKSRGPGRRAQVLTASVIRSGAAVLGHPTRYCQTRYSRPTRSSDAGRTTSSTAGPPTGDLTGCTSPAVIYVHACDPAGRPDRQSILDALQLLFLFLYDWPGGSNILEQFCHRGHQVPRHCEAPSQTHEDCETSVVDRRADTLVHSNFP